MRRSVFTAPLLAAAVAPLLMGAACSAPAAAPHATPRVTSPRATAPLATSPRATAPLATSPRAASTGPYTVAVIDTDTQGRVFTDPNFLVLYRDTKDAPATGAFDCTGPCLKLYHPLLTQPGAALTMPPGVAGTLASVVRPDGVGDQVTVNGYPVYTYSGDQAGDTNGLMGVWSAIPAPVQVP